MNDIDIRRGDIFWVRNSDYSEGSEERFTRPGIVVSSDYGNRTSDCVIIVYMTTQEKRNMVIHVPVYGTKPATALCEQVFTVSKDRLEKYIRTCSEKEMQAIDKALAFSLCMVQPAAPDADAKVLQLQKQLEEYRTMENAKIKELDALLDAEKTSCKVWKKRAEDATKAIEEASNRYMALKEELNAANETIEEMKDAEGRFAITRQEFAAMCENNEEKIKAQAERDVYKQIYENLLDRLLRED